MDSETKILVRTIIEENSDILKKIIRNCNCYYHNKSSGFCFKIFDSNNELHLIRLKYNKDRIHELALIADTTDIVHPDISYIYLSDLIDMNKDYLDVCNLFVESLNLKYSLKGAEL